MKSLTVQHALPLYAAASLALLWLLWRFAVSRGMLPPRARYAFYVSRTVFKTSYLHAALRAFSLGALVLSLGSLLLASAGLTAVSVSDKLKNNDYAVLFVLDVSPSMAIRDVNGISRLEQAKDIIRRFTRQETGASAGVITFGDVVRFSAPFSQNGEAVAMLADASRIGELGNGSALSDALFYAERVLLASSSASRDMVVISDGVQNSGSVPASELRAYRFAVPVVFLHMGSSQNGYFQYVDPRSGTLMRGYANPSEESASEAIAKDINARYIHVQTMPDVRRALDELELRSAGKGEIESQKAYNDLSSYLLISFLAFFALFVFFRVVLLRSL